MASGAMLDASRRRGNTASGCTTAWWSAATARVSATRTARPGPVRGQQGHGNGLKERRGGIDIRDSQDARVKNNNFGPATIAGESYPANGDKIGVRATDSGRSDRVNLSNIDVVGNEMNGERIVSCGGQVACSNNTSVSSRRRGVALMDFDLLDPWRLAKESRRSRGAFGSRPALQQGQKADLAEVLTSCF